MSVAKYYPHAGGKGRLRLGLSSIPISEWIQYEKDFKRRIEDKKRLIKENKKRVLNAFKESISAQHELLEHIVKFLQEHQQHLFRFKDRRIISLQDKQAYQLDEFSECPLELITFLVPDDICVLKPNNEDYELIAASVCAPTWWELSEKMGKSLTSIHAPIFGLEEKIGRMIRHFLRNLHSNDCFQRANWFLLAKGDWCVFPHQFDMYSDMSEITVENIENKLFIRTERQTFRKLPKTEAIIFGIKIYISPISVIRKEPLIGKDLLTALGIMSAAQKESMLIDQYESELVEYIQKVI